MLNLGGRMDLIKEPKNDAKNPIPVMDIDSGYRLEGENDDSSKYYRTAECAYYKAEARGFEPGHEIDDWLAAEDEYGL